MIIFEHTAQQYSDTRNIRLDVYNDIMEKETDIRNTAIETSKHNMKKETNLLHTEIEEEVGMIYEKWPLPESTDIRILTSPIYRKILEEESHFSSAKIAERLYTYTELWPSLKNP